MGNIDSSHLVEAVQSASGVAIAGITIAILGAICAVVALVQVNSLSLAPTTLPAATFLARQEATAGGVRRARLALGNALALQFREC